VALATLPGELVRALPDTPRVRGLRRQS
jgi:hypothetical protein